jgi:hypothetical protein
VILDENKKTVVYKRYYHVFRKGELEDLLLKNFKNVEVLESFFDHASWGVILKKTK